MTQTKNREAGRTVTLGEQSRAMVLNTLGQLARIPAALREAWNEYGDGDFEDNLHPADLVRRLKTSFDNLYEEHRL